MRITLFILLMMVNRCSADVYQIATKVIDSKGVCSHIGGTAICIHTDKTNSVLLTCRHTVVDSPDQVLVLDGGQWYPCEPAQLSVDAKDDVAVIRIGRILKPTPMAASDASPESRVSVCGFGPLLQLSTEPPVFEGKVILPGLMVGDDGTHAIPGDSGGAILQNGECVGMVTGFVTLGKATFPRTRKDLSLRSPLNTYATVKQVWQEIDRTGWVDKTVDRIEE